MLANIASVALMALLVLAALPSFAQAVEQESAAASPAPSAGSQASAEEPPQRTLTTRPSASSGRWRSAEELDTAASSAPAEPEVYQVPAGTRIPLGLIKSISTRSAAPGDRVYLETLFPIVIDNKVVIPPGSHVLGTVTASKRPGRMKGKGELHIRFDSLILPNGVTRSFLARVGGLDGGLREGLDREEGIVKGDSDKGEDVMTVAGTTITGGSIGTMGGLAAGSAARGAGIGLAAGAAAGLATVLLTRGPDVMLPAGTSVELVTDRLLEYGTEDLRFETTARGVIRTNPEPTVNQQRQGIGRMGRGIPY